MKIVNCTPHAITIEGMDILEPSGIVPRVSTDRIVSDPVGGIRIIKQVTGSVTDLPASKPATIYIVSGMVLAALNGSRPDVYAPDTGSDAVRNDKGHIIAVRGLVQ